MTRKGKAMEATVGEHPLSDLRSSIGIGAAAMARLVRRPLKRIYMYETNYKAFVAEFGSGEADRLQRVYERLLEVVKAANDM